MRIYPNNLPDAAVPTLPVEKRRADSLNLVAEGRVMCRPRPGSRPADRHRFVRVPDFEYATVGGGVGWWAPNPEIGYPGVPGYLGEFFVAGLIEFAPSVGREWSMLQLTQAGEFLFSLWLRDRDRQKEEAYAAEVDHGQPDTGPAPAPS